MVLGQLKTDEKSNEITAIPQLLGMLKIKGHTVTTDAMGCQKEIAKVIDDGEGNYVLQVKDNQPTLHQEIAEYFESQIGGTLQPNEDIYLETFDKDHGRLEKRQYWHSHDIEWFADRSLWSGLGDLG